jgi:FtsH-binding integral membrane protein
MGPSTIPDKRQIRRTGFGHVSTEAEPSLLAKVYGLLAFTLVFASIGALIGYGMQPSAVLYVLPIELLLVAAINKWQEVEGWNLALLYAFAFASGVTCGPLLAVYVHGGFGWAVLESICATFLITLGLSGLAMANKTAANYRGPQLLAALVGLLALSVVAIVIGNDLLQLVVTWAGAALFSLLIYFDVQRTRSMPNTLGSAVIIALDIYLDAVNLLLRLLELMSSGDD